MKQLFLISALLLAFCTASAQVDSTMNIQLNRQIQNKSSMNKSSGNTQPPSTANIQNNRKARKMVNTTPKGTIKTDADKPVTPSTPAITSGVAPNNENTNTITPSVINGNKDGKEAGTKVPSP
jgi:cytoskeletal protein RodZ